MKTPIEEPAQTYQAYSEPHEPREHEHELRIGDTIPSHRGRLRIVGWIGMGMPLSEITLKVEPVGQDG